MNITFVAEALLMHSQKLIHCELQFILKLKIYKRK